MIETFSMPRKRYATIVRPVENDLLPRHHEYIRMEVRR